MRVYVKERESPADNSDRYKTEEREKERKERNSHTKRKKKRG